MKTILLLLITLTSLSAQDKSSDIDPLLFKTWYLYSVSVDLGETNYYYGEDVSRMTIYEDLSFYATDNCWEISGNFQESEGPHFGDFGLEMVDYEKACILGGSSSYVLELVYEFDQTIGCYVEAEYMSMETYAGFVHGFKSEITLSAPTHTLNEISIFPNPTSDIIHIQNISQPIDLATLYSLNGNIIKTYTTIYNKINISEVPSGMYFLVLEIDGATTVKRIVRE
ncbi:hypothetical protein ULMA_08670 [Patiriisocius marinus]|uniref:Secretion system C-terminal sorting domain-containing protein n=1 Tax=Patiriisocius marinus TaxID=1397112 RepID=A0A5J4IN58_9FLAO|nr:T9SS type A sorting domain-containing protein [Patiriisocius marinus]GER58759.1 hypothetical protein ULMA_08670 [Patiriisocius marinus]